MVPGYCQVVNFQEKSCRRCPWCWGHWRLGNDLDSWEEAFKASISFQHCDIGRCHSHSLTVWVSKCLTNDENTEQFWHWLSEWLNQWQGSDGPGHCLTVSESLQVSNYWNWHFTIEFIFRLLSLSHSDCCCLFHEYNSSGVTTKRRWAITSPVVCGQFLTGSISFSQLSWFVQCKFTSSCRFKCGDCRLL